MVTISVPVTVDVCHPGGCVMVAVNVTTTRTNSSAFVVRLYNTYKLIIGALNADDKC